MMNSYEAQQPLLHTHDAAAGVPQKETDILAILADVALPAMAGREQQAKTAAGSLQPYPFFHYKDHSRDVDPDPLYTLVPPGRVPNFPAKIHAILSRPDLQDVITWLPHGRSWQVLKPREFETKVLPQYFDHSRYSSFVRQTNGWGFRRITQGKGQNSYYHPLFLRGLAHLSKGMKRQCGKGQKKKVPLDADQEPDLFKISELFPVPEKADHESIMLSRAMQGNPSARMPFYGGSHALQQPAAVVFSQPQVTLSRSPEPLSPPATPPQQGVPPAPLTSFTGAASPPTTSIAVAVPPHHANSPVATAIHFTNEPHKTNEHVQKPAVVKAADATPQPMTVMMPFPFMNSGMPMFFPQMMYPPTMMVPGQQTSSGSSATPDASGSSHFAAGFAAAAAMSQQHFTRMFQQNTMAAANNA
ncbi:shock factor protein [Seminavis robusta]|uniref:Shock factor protein n=1 Tax=Seminavis robusta TaxID=568900 RepID=A0A9N8HXI1_9STRA|nr:shock factor protein [Seminavis robusta]|eukprot:Sro1811_g299210.1 shock factor protein (415) ;mRNA; f:13753-15082